MQTVRHPTILALVACACACATASNERPDGVTGAVSKGAAPLSVLVSVLAARGPDAMHGHAEASMTIAANTGCGGLTTDGTNALLHAVVYDEGAALPARASHAQAAAAILDDWATVSQAFHGPNGFLCAAWNIGALARAAYILKTDGSPEYAAIAPRFEAWARNVADSYWLPAGASPPPGSTPELLQHWELTHVSNRSMVCLEATLHVARLVGDMGWVAKVASTYKRFASYQNFSAPSADAGSATTYFVDAEGKNADDFRGDIWHQTAGLASSVQIAAVLLAETGEDLFSFDGGILLRSLEKYGAVQLRDGGGIPFWDTAARAFPKSSVIADVAAGVQRAQTGAYVPYIVTYSWGLGETLALAPGGGSPTPAPAAGCDAADAITVTGGNSANFGSTGPACYRTGDAIQGWGCAGMDGRSVAVDGVSIACGAMPLPAKRADGYRYFAFTSGTEAWASFYWW